MNLQSLSSAALLLLCAVVTPGTLAADEDFNPEGFMDSAYILPCDRNQGYYPVYCADGCTYGPAWYCNSGEWVGDKYDTCNGEPGCAHLGGGDFDVAHIHHGCSGSVVFTSTLTTICGCAMMLRNSRKIKRKVRCSVERLRLNKGINYVEKERMVTQKINLESDQ